MATLEQKLATVENRLKQWRTRLTKASNMVVKLDKARRRYQLQLLNPDQPVVAVVKVKTPKPVVTETTDLPELDAFFQPEVAHPEKLDIPQFLKRDDPDPSPQAVADLLDPAAAINRIRLERNAKRGVKKPVDKTAMPLTGKAALAAIKKK